VVRLPARAPSGLCVLGGVPRHARAAAGEREAARRGRRRGARGAGAAAGARPLRPLRATDAGRLFGQRRPRRALCLRARASTARHRAGLPVARRPAGRRAVAGAFLEAVTPAGARASAGAIGELERQHAERLAGQRLALERAEFEAERARRQFDAYEPEHRLVARTLERRLERALTEVERERRQLAALERARPAPLSAEERRALARLARDLPRLWDAKTTTDRDRKELLRALLSEVIVTVREPERLAELELVWEGGRAASSRFGSTAAAPSATAPTRTRSS
jgi:hypothetical protein